MGAEKQIAAGIAGVMALGAAWYATRGWEALQSKPPHAVFPIMEKDLGKINAGEPMDLTFPVKNAGGKVLHIQAVKGSCGCLSTDFKPKGGIRALHSGEITVRFEPMAHWTGSVDKEITVNTDDPVTPTALLELHAQIIPFITYVPNNPLQVPLHRGQSVHQELKLTPRPGTHLTLGPLKCDSKLVKAKLIPPAASDPSHTYRIEMTVGPAPGPGDYMANLQLNTNESKLQIANILVATLALEGPVVAPREILLTSVDRGEKDKQLIQIQVFTRGQPLKLLGVETGNPNLKAVPLASTINHLYNISIQQVKPLPPGRLQTNLIVKTDDQDNPIIKIPFDATVRETILSSAQGH